MSIEAYANLDLTQGSDAVRELMALVAHESQIADIALTGDGDDGAAAKGLTPAMADWIRLHVSPTRNAALNDVRQNAAKVKLGPIDGIAHDIEEDSLFRAFARKKYDAYASFREKFGEKLTTKMNQVNEYEREKNHKGRDAKNYNKLAQWTPGLVAGFLEAIFNFSNLVEIFDTGIAALGMTGIIALAVGLSVHFAGKSFTERPYLSSIDDDRKVKNLWYLFGGLLLLLAIVTFLFILQYDSLLDEQARAVLVGKEPPNLLISIFGLIGGNLIIYAVGIIWTSKMYDDDPDFAEKAAKAMAAEKMVATLKEEHLAKPKKRLETELAASLRALEAKSKQMNGLQGFDSVRAKLSAIEKKDEEVIGRLGQYRSALQLAKERTDSAFRFGKPVAERVDDEPVLDATLAAFASTPLYLYKALT